MKDTQAIIFKSLIPVNYLNSKRIWKKLKLEFSLLPKVMIICDRTGQQLFPSVTFQEFFQSSRILLVAVTADGRHYSYLTTPDTKINQVSLPWLSSDQSMLFGPKCNSKHISNYMDFQPNFNLSGVSTVYFGFRNWEPTTISKVGKYVIWSILK